MFQGWVSHPLLESYHAHCISLNSGISRNDLNSDIRVQNFLVHIDDIGSMGMVSVCVVPVIMGYKGAVFLLQATATLLSMLLKNDQHLSTLSTATKHTAYMKDSGDLAKPGVKLRFVG